MKGRHVSPTRRGLTLVEILLAVLLASFVMVAVVRFVDVSLGLWSRSEEQRTRHGRAHVLLERLAKDLETMHPGQLGDFLVEWIPFDLGGDSAAERIYPRLRWVRRPGAVDWRRLTLESMSEAERQEYLELGFGIGSPAQGDLSADPEALEEVVQAPSEWRHMPGLSEVYWALVPTITKDLDGSGTLFRMEQKLPTGAARQGVSTLLNLPLAQQQATWQGEADARMTDGVLWLGIEMFGDDTVHEEVGAGPGQRRSAWDALGRRRPNPELAPPNATAVQKPSLDGKPVLPRGMRLVLELESADERERRPALLEGADREQNFVELTRGELLPPGEEVHVRIGGEWMRVLSRDGDRIAVERGRRGTLPSLHAAGARVHFGTPVERTVWLPTARMRPAMREAAQ